MRPELNRRISLREVYQRWKDDSSGKSGKENLVTKQINAVAASG